MQEGVSFKEFAARRAPSIETALRSLLPRSCIPGTERLNRAVEYVINSGGKRTRPLLLLAVGEIFEGGIENLLPAACAIEFLHLSSVILDDLPTMDDGQLRRHLPALHLVFGEATAILAAMALFARAFELFAVDRDLATRAAQAVGCNGMTGGQAADLEAVSPGRLEKTAALLRLTFEAGGIASHAPTSALGSLSRCGQLIGEAYQIFDDLLDVLASRNLTGKTPGQDLRHGRVILGQSSDLEAAAAQLARLSTGAVEIVKKELPPAGGAGIICDFAVSLLEKVRDLGKQNGLILCNSAFSGSGGG